MSRSALWSWLPQQEARPLDHPLRLAPEHRDLPRARAVGGVRVEPEEAPLAGHLAGRVEALDADVVEVRRAVHGRPRVRLRQVEQVLLARQPAHLRRQLREADRDRPLVGRAQDAEPRAGHGTQHVLPVLGEDFVLAVAEEREVAVVHPLEQVAGLRRARPGRPEPSASSATTSRTRSRIDGQSSTAARTSPSTRQRPARSRSSSSGPAWRSISTWISDSGCPSSAPTSSSRPSSSRRMRMIGRITRWIALPLRVTSIETESTRKGMSSTTVSTTVCARLPPVLLDVRRVDVHLQLAGPPDAREVPVRDRGAVEVEVAPVAQVVGSDVRVVRADEPLDVFRLGALDPLVDARDRGLEERRLPLIRARRQSPTSLGCSSEYGLA